MRGLGARRAARTASVPAEGREHVRAECEAQEAVEADERREDGQEGAEAVLVRVRVRVRGRVRRAGRSRGGPG